MLDRLPVARVQICEANRLAHWPHLDERLRELGYLVDTERCLDRCTRCRHTAFAVVSGRYWFAVTVRQFLSELRKRIPVLPWGR